MKTLLLIIFAVAFTLINYDQAFASHNPNLYVSAENPIFKNRFTGSMVIEVVINDPNIRDTDEGKGEPDVTINGKDLRMVQGTDGQWYAYFANVDKAKIADQIASQSSVDGEGLDFGVFCSRDTSSTVFGVSFSDTDGIAVPHSTGISSFTNGDSSFNSCTGSPTNPPTILNNVIRNTKSINTNSPLTGQIGLDEDAWPVIQLYSFGDVVIRYNKGGGTQQVNLEYDKSENISLNLDRTNYPTNAEVFVTINDMQLNQDPTSRDSWTFNINSPLAVFYQAFDENGNDAVDIVNLKSNLASLDFEDNGIISMTLGSTAELKTNNRQPDASVSDGVTTFSQIITFVETAPNSGIFENFDFGDVSTIKISDDAPRGQSATISYDSKSYSIISGSTTASISMISNGSTLQAGQKQSITIIDPDQNINSGARDDLDVFRSTALIPSLTIGNPITLEKATNVLFYPFSTSDLSNDGTSANSSVPDKSSDLLFIDASSLALPNIEKFALNLGVTANDLTSLFIDSDPPETEGTNWINYDLRSFEKQLDISDFSDTSIALFFGLDDTTPIILIDAGDISSAQGLVELNDSDINSINNKSGAAFLVVNFDASDHSSAVGKIDSETDTQPIVIDFFSFGLRNNEEVNNAIYRLELEETAANSSTFTGTIEYTVANQLNIFDSDIIQSLKTIDNEIEFLVNDRMIDEQGVIITYSDLAEVGVNISTSSKTDIRTNSGSISISPEYRIGRPVVITLYDPDLNVKHDTIESYFVIDDPNSENVDTVGNSNGGILLEVLIKGVRFQRCTIDGIEYGGLASTGFTLTEAGTNTGIFEGIFKMPSRICNKTGTQLISIKGGSVEVKYHDFRDALGESNIFSFTPLSSATSQFKAPQLNDNQFTVPDTNDTTEVTLTGKVANYKPGTSIKVTVIYPDKRTSEHSLSATKDGSYKAILTLKGNSILGQYTIFVNYQNSPQGTTTFNLIKHIVPEWIKNNAGWWTRGQISDEDFVKGIEYMITEKIIIIPESELSASSEKIIPSWIKNTASWWHDNLISDDEFVSALEFLVKKGIIRI